MGSLFWQTQKPSPPPCCLLFQWPTNLPAIPVQLWNRKSWNSAAGRLKSPTATCCLSLPSDFGISERDSNGSDLSGPIQPVTLGSCSPLPATSGTTLIQINTVNTAWQQHHGFGEEHFVFLPYLQMAGIEPRTFCAHLSCLCCSKFSLLPSCMLTSNLAQYSSREVEEQAMLQLCPCLLAYAITLGPMRWLWLCWLVTLVLTAGCHPTGPKSRMWVGE